MRIANCFVDKNVATFPDPVALVRSWSEDAQIASDAMTINIVRAARGGAEAGAMVWLSLPDMWSETDLASLQEGIAALDDAPSHTDAATHVITMIVRSGNVVADGTTLSWVTAGPKSVPQRNRTDGAVRPRPPSDSGCGTSSRRRIHERCRSRRQH